MQKEKEYKQILLVDSLYVLLIYLILNSKVIFKTFFFIGENIKLEFFKEFNSIKIEKIKKKSKINKIIYNLKLIIYLSLKVKKLNLKKVKVYGQDHIVGGNYFLKFHDFFVIEDGAINYSEIMLKKELKKKKKIVDYLFLQTSFYGLSENVKKYI